jgi:predicted DCC family thiol-disulfide oxidoreductase YuxK
MTAPAVQDVARLRGDEVVVLDDGVCGLCNGVFQFVLPRDRRSRIRFAALQGSYAAETLARHGIAPPPGAPQSIVVVAHPGTSTERLYFRSEAALRIGAALQGPWRLIGLLRIVPRVLRDWVYDRVARSRYRVFGRFDACPIPSPETRARFLD